MHASFWAKETGWWRAGLDGVWTPDGGMPDFNTDPREAMRAATSAAKAADTMLSLCRAVPGSWMIH